MRKAIMSTSRRSFIASSVTLVAGAAFRMPSRRSLRKHGPVSLYTNFIFFKEPIEIKSELFVDEGRDVFGIRCFDERGIQRAIIKTSFLNLKAVLKDSPGKIVCLCFDDEDKEVRATLAVVREAEKVTFLIDDGNGGSHPFWMDLADILKVL